MKFDIHFPMILHGRPKRARAEQPMLLSYRYETDVPEVSYREVNVVASVSLALDGPAQTNRHCPELRPGKTTYVYVEHGARLYRRVASAGEMRFHNFLARPFTDTEFHNPAGFPVLAHVANQMGLRTGTTGVQSVGVRDAWPRTNDDLVDFHEYEPRIASFSTEDMETAQAMFARRSEGLLLVDGGFWVETAPPCFAVRHQQYRADASVRRYSRHMQQESARDPFAIHFPLSKSREADDYALWLRSTLGVSGMECSDATFVQEAGGLTEFDNAREAADRMARRIARYCQRDLGGEPELRARQTPSLVAALDAIWEAMLSENAVLGIEHDLSGHLRDMYQLWQDTGARLPHMVFGAKSRRVVELLVERALEDVDNRPIDIVELGLAPKLR